MTLTYREHLTWIAGQGYDTECIDSSPCWHWIVSERIYTETTNCGTVVPPAAGADFSLRTWTRLNRLRSGVGRFGASVLRWGLVESDRCDSQNGRPRHQRTLPCLSTTRGRARIRGAGRNYAQVAREDRT